MIVDAEFVKVVGAHLAAGGLAVGFPVEDWAVKRENRARKHGYREVA